MKRTLLFTSYITSSKKDEVQKKIDILLELGCWGFLFYRVIFCKLGVRWEIK